MRGVEIFEEVHVAIVVIGRVEENEVGNQVAGGQFFEAAFGVGQDHFDAGANIEGFEVLAREAYGGGIAVDEENFAGASADGFDSDGAGAGVKVDEKRIFDGGAEDVEERFAEAVAGGADAQEAWGAKAAAAIFSGDDSHDLVRRGVQQFILSS